MCCALRLDLHGFLGGLRIALVDEEAFGLAFAGRKIDPQTPLFFE